MIKVVCTRTFSPIESTQSICNEKKEWNKKKKSFLDSRACKSNNRIKHPPIVAHTEAAAAPSSRLHNWKTACECRSINTPLYFSQAANTNTRNWKKRKKTVSQRAVVMKWKIKKAQSHTKHVQIRGGGIFQAASNDELQRHNGSFCYSTPLSFVDKNNKNNNWLRKIVCFFSGCEMVNKAARFAVKKREKLLSMDVLYVDAWVVSWSRSRSKLVKEKKKERERECMFQK